jgi:hypothetical protein
MTVLCIWIAGWASSALTATWLPYRLAGTGVGLSLVYQSFAAAFIGGFVLRAVLPRLADASISYPWAVLALGLGGLAANGLTYLAQSFTLRHAPPAVAPMIWSNPMLGFAATAISLLVTYQVILLAASRPVSHDFSAPRALPDEAPTDDSLSDVVARTDQAVTRACLDLSRSGGQSAGPVVDALTELGVCEHSLQHTTATDPKVRAAVEQLVDGLNRFQTSLTQIAADSSATASQHVYQRGWLIGSMADVSDGGSLARYELDHADGLATIRDALERLRQLGVAGPT